jgi:hypothetical protein
MLRATLTQEQGEREHNSAANERAEAQISAHRADSRYSLIFFSGCLSKILRGPSMAALTRETCCE